MGAYLDTTDECRFSAIMVAAQRIHYKCIEALIMAGADVNIGGDIGITPLMLTIGNCDTEFMRASYCEILLAMGYKSSE